MWDWGLEEGAVGCSQQRPEMQGVTLYRRYNSWSRSDCTPFDSFLCTNMPQQERATKQKTGRIYGRGRKNNLKERQDNGWGQDIGGTGQWDVGEGQGCRIFFSFSIEFGDTLSMICFVTVLYVVTSVPDLLLQLCLSLVVVLASNLVSPFAPISLLLVVNVLCSIDSVEEKSLLVGLEDELSEMNSKQYRQRLAQRHFINTVILIFLYV